MITRDTWPIAAALLQFPNRSRRGEPMQDAEPEEWFDVFSEIASADFDHVELADTWVRVGDLSPQRAALLVDAAQQAGLKIPSLAIIRSSILDPKNAVENLRYSHRTIDAAAAVGASVVSVGLHRPLTTEQKKQLWFWTKQGATDAPDDADSWASAVHGFTELGTHAASVGLELSLEMYEDTFLGTADSAVRLVEEIGLSNVGLNPDIGNLVRLHRPIESWEELIEKTVPYANYWHIKNYFRDEDPVTGSYFATPAPLELGLINYRWAIKEALAAGFTGVFVCEHYGGDGLSVSARNRDYIRSLLPSGVPATSYVRPTE
jgi:sugar phosphate isomerase/epimerase